MIRILFLCLIIPVSCHYQRPLSESGNQTLINDTLPIMAGDISDSAELVFDFYYRFTSDTGFQLQRIKFPVEIQIDNENITVQKTDWIHDNLFSNLQYTTQIADFNKSGFDYNADYGDKSIFSWIYPSLNKRKDYYFIREKNRWYLSRIIISKMNNEDPENFISFLQRFMNDPEFQIKRTKFPFKVTTWTGSEEESRDTTYFQELSEWSFFSLYNGLDSLTNFVNDWDPGIKENDKLNLFVGGMENGISVTYNFEKIDNSWILTGLQDKSD
ncbi:MAG: DUF4348 domain-containing protein [Methanococcaceae archaeon]